MKKLYQKNQVKKILVIILFSILLITLFLSALFVQNYSRYSEVKESEASSSKPNIDFNTDKNIDLNDFRNFVEVYRICNSSDTDNPQNSSQCISQKADYDLDDNGKVDIQDFVVFADGYKICNKPGDSNAQDSNECKAYKGSEDDITIEPSPTSTEDLDGECTCHVTGKGCGKKGLFKGCEDFDETESRCVKENECTESNCCTEAEKVAEQEAENRGAVLESFECNAEVQWTEGGC
ncbi:hypothetical protein GF362_02300 [Candidatus Dojkabacteria bacterium]|nr:hypothetical protein [Candidatus Dojkabacteria bacterium]